MTVTCGAFRRPLLADNVVAAEWLDENTLTWLATPAKM